MMNKIIKTKKGTFRVYSKIFSISGNDRVDLKIEKIKFFGKENFEFFGLEKFEVKKVLANFAITEALVFTDEYLLANDSETSISQEFTHKTINLPAYLK